MAWKLRHLKRSVLKDTATMAAYAPAEDNDEWFLRDSIDMLGRAVGNSAKAAGALFSDLSLAGQVNLLTTGAFDSPLQLLQLDRTNSVAFFSVGAPVGSHGNWSVRAAMNQTDLSSWTLDRQLRRQRRRAASLPVRHVVQPAALRGRQRRRARCVVRHGAQRRFDVRGRRMADHAALHAGLRRRVRALRLPARPVALQSERCRRRSRRRRTFACACPRRGTQSAPGAEEFLPPSRAEYLPPQRTFSPLSRAAGFQTQELDHYEVSVERVMNGATIAQCADVPRADRRSAGHGVRAAKARREATAIGHYYVGAAGDADITGFGVTFTHALLENVADRWTIRSRRRCGCRRRRARELAALERWVPGAIRGERERIHDVTTTLQTEIPVHRDARRSCLQAEQRLHQERRRSVRHPASTTDSTCA